MHNSRIIIKQLQEVCLAMKHCCGTGLMATDIPVVEKLEHSLLLAICPFEQPKFETERFSDSSWLKFTSLISHDNTSHAYMCGVTHEHLYDYPIELLLYIHERMELYYLSNSN